MVTVLCMTGWCRNGSTIIGNILNEIPSFMHVGELHFQWKKAVGQGVNNLCGCGMVLTDCPFWSAALTTTIPHGAALGDFAAEVVRRQRAGVRTRHTWRLLQHGADRADVRAHAALTTLSYAEIAARSGARVIWIPRRSPVRPRCCRTWTESDPAGTIDRLVRPCGMDPAANPVRGRTVDLHANHTVTGNPDRFLTGPTVLRNADDRWRASLSGRARLAATLLSWPLSLRYGYTGPDRRSGRRHRRSRRGAGRCSAMGPGLQHFTSARKDTDERLHRGRCRRVFRSDDPDLPQFLGRRGRAAHRVFRR